MRRRKLQNFWRWCPGSSPVIFTVLGVSLLLISRYAGSVIVGYEKEGGAQAAAHVITSTRPPGVAVVERVRGLMVFEPPPSSPDGFEMEREGIRVTVRRASHAPASSAPSSGNGDQPDELPIWELELSVTRGQVEFVHFPWEQQREPLDNWVDDDVIYYPFLLGVAERMRLMGEWNWQEKTYPGSLLAPLVVVADDDDARIVAAANWPPRAVDVLYSLDRLTLRYAEIIPAGQTRLFSAVIARVSRRSAPDASPWQLAVDLYKSWLRAHLPTFHPSPLPVPPDVHGWINIQLENQPRFDPQQILCLWERWKQHFPWVQFWGQMSNYAGPPERAVPPLRPGEPVGCCLDWPKLHPRYRNKLPALIQHIRSDGGCVGLYSRPRDPYRRLDDPEDILGDRRWLLKWIRRNRRLGANACYIDVLGSRYFGEPLQIADLVRRIDELTLPQGEDPITGFPVVIEGVVDIYPAPGLISGSLSGGDWNGGPGRDVFTHGRTTFPRFGRYLLDDRDMFLGQSNGDWRFWGRENGYWTECQAFLLGARLDVMNFTEGDLCSGELNEAVVHIVELRSRVAWWRRGCRYLDQRGITEIPPGIDARLFRDSGGVDLLVIDNPSRLKGQRLMLRGEPVDIPEEALAIVEVPRK